jgi:ornithine carbamoyltransferase
VSSLMASPDTGTLAGRDLLAMTDLAAEELVALLDLADALKRAPGRDAGALAGRSLAAVFEKPSTRTRVSFDVAMYQLGGHTVTLPAGELQLARGEPLRDTALVLSRYVDAIMLRTAAHARVVELAQWADVPVVNGLSDLHHPCQALADLQTLRERLGDLAGRRLAWVGDGANNVCHSLAAGAVALGMEVVVAAPRGYRPDPDALGVAAGAIAVVDDPASAVAGANAVVTDTWTSMGQEHERERRVRDLAPYQVNRGLLAGAAPSHVVLHCLPAHAGEEITADLLYAPDAAVWDEAENRLHAQKALLLSLIP